MPEDLAANVRSSTQMTQGYTICVSYLACCMQGLGSLIAGQAALTAAQDESEPETGGKRIDRR